MSDTPNTLLLNASFEPLRVVHWQRAFGLVFQDKVEVLEEYGVSIHSVTRVFKVPAVIRLKRWVHFGNMMYLVRFSRENVYLRDGYCCQYCNNQMSDRDLTLDHVIPAVRGGRKCWENIVTACKRCNQFKGDRTPEEAGLTLQRPPRRPKWLAGELGVKARRCTPEIWEPYLVSVAVQDRIFA